jgi:hypothetical protein
MSTNNKISSLISSQVPFFVRNDHPNFVAFLEAYYEYLEQSGITLEDGKAIERGKNLPNYFDVDRTLDDFSQLLYNHFLKFLPRDIIADKDLLIKHIQDFYKARGTEKSARFLFNILFNKPITFYYPKRDVLKASDGKWIFEKYLNVQDMAIQNVANSELAATQRFINTKVTGRISKASAVIDHVIRTESNGVTVDKLQISSSRGTFVPGEQLYALKGDTNVEYLTANLLANAVTSVEIINQGSSYNVGDYVIVESVEGSGANLSISKVSNGEVIDLVLIYGGAGFQVGNPLTFTAAKGSGASGAVIDVDSSGAHHANTYNIWTSLISGEASTLLSSSLYSSLRTDVVSSPNVNSRLVDVLNYTQLTGLGPITLADLTLLGSGYVIPPTVDVVANTMLRGMNALGRVDIVRGGQDYLPGDVVTFENLPGQTGFGALAQVINISLSGAVTKVDFVQYNSEPLGGSGYSAYPTASISSANGTGALLAVGAIMGDGEQIQSVIDKYGKIKAITINEGGSGYSGVTLNLKSFGDGTATANATVSSGRVDGFKRYLNDDGMISAYNFLQNRDYYQNYSYLISVKESISSYKEAVKNLLHPSGMKLFGEYDHEANTATLATANIQVDNALIDTISIRKATFQYTNTEVVATISLTSHGFLANDNVYIEFITANTLSDNTYFVVDADTDQFNVSIEAATANGSGNAIVYMNVV